MKRTIALAAAIAALVPGVAKSAQRDKLCDVTVTGWTVWSNNTATPCSFASDVYFRLAYYQVGHTIHFNKVYFFPTRSSANRKLYRVRCKTAPEPLVSATCKANGMSITVQKVKKY
jgi:hypothetical protein